MDETARSICERYSDHHKDYKDNLEKSHMSKHVELAHSSDSTKPEFDVRIIKFCKTAIERQVFEAVQIASRANEQGVTILNSKSEFNRCSLPRIVMYCGENSNENQGIGPKEKGEEDLKALPNKKTAKKRVQHP